MEKDLIKQFLNFRRKFTKEEWTELNQIIEDRENEKADQLQLDDLDIQIIEERLSHKNDKNFSKLENVTVTMCGSLMHIEP